MINSIDEKTIILASPCSAVRTRLDFQLNKKYTPVVRAASIKTKMNQEMTLLLSLKASEMLMFYQSISMGLAALLNFIC